MKQLNLTYMNHFRRKYDYCGHLWQDRFKSNLIDVDSYLLQCGKYIELNPVRAGIVTQPRDFEFSSYRHYADGVKDELLDYNPVYLGLSSIDQERQKLYQNFVVDEQVMRDNLNKYSFIGSQTFVNKIQEYYGILAERRKRGRPKKKRK